MQDSSERKCLLKQVEKQELDAKKFGFYWENFNQLIEQIQSECTEIQQAWQSANTQHIEEEIGDLMQAAISLAVFCRLDPQKTLQKSIDKFQKRYDKVTQLAKNDGFVSLHNQPFEILMNYWKRAKIEMNSNNL